jgi:hypothetical protein
VTAVGGRGAAVVGEAPRLKAIKVRRLGQDVLLSGEVVREE